MFPTFSTTTIQTRIEGKVHSPTKVNTTNKETKKQTKMFFHSSCHLRKIYRQFHPLCLTECYSESCKCELETVTACGLLGEGLPCFLNMQSSFLAALSLTTKSSVSWVQAQVIRSMPFVMVSHAGSATSEIFYFQGLQGHA